MSSFSIIDEKRFPIKTATLDGSKDLLNFWRFEHRVTVGYNGRRFMVLVDQLKGTAYVEEISSGDIEVITDDNLWEDIIKWVAEKGFLFLMPPILKPKPPRFL